jgi:multiple sugar transport system substrate-binding protein
MEVEGMKRKVLLLTITILLLSFSLFGKAVELTYMYWGSPEERVAQENMLTEFEKAYQDVFPGIKVKALHVPANYDEKIASMVAGGNPPQIAQLVGYQACEWAEKNVVYDINSFIRNDPTFDPDDYLDTVWVYSDHGNKVAGVRLANEIMVTWYNKEIFDDNNVSYPPSDPTKWTWDLFLETAIRLTTDRNGKHPNEEGFDPSKIKTYGVMVPNEINTILPLIWSNGGDIVDESGKVPTVTNKEVIEVIQLISDLIHKYHVAPSSSQISGLPASYVALQTKQVAMVLAGQWTLLDLGKMEQQGRLKLGVAPLPYIKEPIAFILGSPNAIFTDAVKGNSDVLKATWELYKWAIDSEKVLPLIQSGLWMPLQKKWYTEPEYIEKWLTPGIHPPEYKEAVIDYVLDYGRVSSENYLINYKLVADIMYQEFELLFSGKISAEEACKNVAKKIEPYLEGRYDK